MLRSKVVVASNTWDREMDLMAKHVTNNEMSAVYFGDAAFPSNSPIDVKGTKHSPDQRKFMVSLKKSEKTDVALPRENALLVSNL